MAFWLLVVVVVVMAREREGALKALEKHARHMRHCHLRDLMFDESRSDDMVLESCDVVVDWCRQKVTSETMELLYALGHAMEVPHKLAKMRRLEVVNPTEHRAACHHERSGVEEVLTFADKARREFRAVIVVGIGGSRLGPELAVRALQKTKSPELRFLSSVDRSAFLEAIAGLDPATTLVVISSKSFTTAETMMSAHKLKTWLKSGGIGVFEKNLACCASNVEKAREFVGEKGIVFGFSDNVGGRFSVSSVPGILPLALAVGSSDARRFLAGMKRVDEHVFGGPLEGNIAFILAAIGVWNTLLFDNFRESAVRARAVVPYCHRLSLFPAHVQQLEMESLGKSVSAQGTPLSHFQTEVLLGTTGTEAQHSFFQLLHQGSGTVPVDFVACLEDDDDDELNADTRDELLANLFAQADALALGTTNDDRPLHENLPGDRPSTTLLLRNMDPENLGALIAIYEHRTAITGFLLDINPFDQPGVEHGKKGAKSIRAFLEQLHVADETIPPHQTSWPPSTQRLIERYLAVKKNKMAHLFPPFEDPSK